MSGGNCFRDPKYREWQIPCPPKDLDYADTPLPDFTVFMIKVGKIKYINKKKFVENIVGKRCVVDRDPHGSALIWL